MKTIQIGIWCLIVIFLIHFVAFNINGFSNFLRAVCSLSSTEVFTKFFQPFGTYSTRTGWITIVIGPSSRLLVDKQKSWSICLRCSLFGKFWI